MARLTDRIEKVAAEVTKSASSTKTPSTVKPNDANVSATQITIRKPKPTPQEFGPAAGNDAAPRDARHLIVNELIKTTPPGSFLYYGNALG